MFSERPNPESLFTAYGEFMFGVALIEHDIHNLFCLLAAVTDDVARVVFGDTTIGDVLLYLPEVTRLSDLPEPTKMRLYEIRIQYKAINKMRNNLAHQINYYDSETATKFRSMPAKKLTHEQALAKIVEYERDALFYAIEDLAYINDQLDIINTNVRSKKYFDLPYEDAMHQPFVPRAWLYIAPLQPPQDRSKNPREDKGRTRE